MAEEKKNNKGYKKRARKKSTNKKGYGKLKTLYSNFDSLSEIELDSQEWTEVYPEDSSYRE